MNWETRYILLGFVVKIFLTLDILCMYVPQVRPITTIFVNLFGSQIMVTLAEFLLKHTLKRVENILFHLYDQGIHLCRNASLGLVGQPSL